MDESYGEYVKRINEMPDDVLDQLIREDKCPYDPKYDKGQAMGMFHCPLCGDMVLAGVGHPRRKDIEDVEELYAHFDSPNTIYPKSVSCKCNDDFLCKEEAEEQ